MMSENKYVATFNRSAVYVAAAIAIYYLASNAPTFRKNFNDFAFQIQHKIESAYQIPR
jgi:hypothetical protein